MGHSEVWQKVAPLFEPLVIRGWTLRNRIVMPPMVSHRDITQPEGIRWYARRARGGVGLIIVEATPIQRFGIDLTAENLRPLVDAVHDAGALIAVQLFMTPLGQSLKPAALTSQEIAESLDYTWRAAMLCNEAGFDGVELHGAHGYTLNRFFSPVQNRRKDEFGGSLENRRRMAVLTVEAAREGIGDGRLILYRHTPIGEGYGIAESITLARALIDADIDILDISPASHERSGDRSAPFVELGVPVIAVNEMDEINRALTVLNEERGDLVAIGRGLIADPDWPLKVRERRLDKIVRCIRCGSCSTDMREGRPIACTQWTE
jgi:2,4-dienoyl-CoA reductase-like NADH-dependent reductase (Old Yellow Enzyme family)